MRKLNATDVFYVTAFALVVGFLYYAVIVSA